jgi:hypothetical protein
MLVTLITTLRAVLVSAGEVKLNAHRYFFKWFSTTELKMRRPSEPWHAPAALRDIHSDGASCCSANRGAPWVRTKNVVARRGGPKRIGEVVSTLAHMRIGNCSASDGKVGIGGRGWIGEKRAQGVVPSRRCGTTTFARRPSREPKSAAAPMSITACKTGRLANLTLIEKACAL